jgi:predicted TIM-barrel fold metal-dependent hydrolase
VAPLHGKRSGWSAARPKTFEELVQEMDAAGVYRACLVHSSTTYGFDPSYVADTVEANPTRFAGVFSIDVTAPDAADRFRYWVSRGLSGIRIYTGGSTFERQSNDLADPRSFPVWEAATELGITVTVQLRPEGLPQLLELVRRFPETTVLVDNTLRPNYREGPPYYGSEHVFMLARYENVHMKIITNGVRGLREGLGSPETFLPRLVDAFGVHRLAWGSNFPASEGTLAQMVREAREAFSCLSEKDREWIFSRTAQRLFPALAADEGFRTQNAYALNGGSQGSAVRD